MLRMGLAPCAPFNVTNDLMVRTCLILENTCQSRMFG